MNFFNNRKKNGRHIPKDFDLDNEANRKLISLIYPVIFAFKICQVFLIKT